MDRPRSFLDHPLLPFGIIAGLLLMAVYVSLDGLERGAIRDAARPGSPLEARDLRFTDHAPGVVAVVDAATDQPIQLLGTGEGMFLRVAIRSFARDRAGLGVGAEVPFTLAAWPDGDLTLTDPTTGRVLRINAYGHSQEAHFRQYLSSTELTKGENG